MNNKSTKLAVLAALLVSCMGAPHTLKHRLAQTNAELTTGPTNGNGTGSPPPCVCELPSGGNLTAGGPLGSGAFVGFGSGVAVSTSENVVTVPDTAFTTNCVSECCACNVGEHSALTQASRTKVFIIAGSIGVTESVIYNEAGNSTSESVGHSDKVTACQTTNVNGPVGNPPGGDCITVCFPNCTAPL